MSKAKFNAKKFERPGLTEDEIEEIKEALRSRVTRGPRHTTLF